jgi:tyrosine-specific transport protein
MSSNKLLGGILIVAGTTIGGGMLALPLASAFAGLGLSSIIMVALWALMTYTALITLEMNLYFNKGVSISYAAEHVLGKAGKAISTFSIAFLFYALLSAYMTGGANIFNQIIYYAFGIELSSSTLIISFSLIFGGVIFARTKIVDTVNRGLLIIKTACFLTIIFIILPKVDIVLLSYTPMEITPYLPLLIPLFLTSFGFHGSIPTIVNYIGPNAKKLKITFILGSTVPLIVYLIWEAIALGVVTLDGNNSFTSIKAAGGDIGLFTQILSNIAGGGWLIAICNGFTFLAVVTSFLGVGLGLFDFMEERLTKHNTTPSSYLTGSFTLSIPLIFALFYPKGFIMALGYAAIALSILAVIMPALIVWKLRQIPKSKAYTVIGGNWGLIIVIACGIGVILLELKAILIN